MKNFIFIFTIILYLINLSVEWTKCSYGFQGKYCDKCGITYYKPNVKIIGGIIAVPHSWPALISLAYKGSHSCGGSLIDRETVLTAAHCFDDFDLNDYKVYVGTQNVENYDNGYSISVKKIIIHPKYDKKSEINDIAILKLSKQAQLSKTVQIACLPREGFPGKRNISVWSAGWGSISFPNYKYPDALRNIKLTLYPFDSCDEVSPNNTKSRKTQLCAGDLAGGRDTCRGDSGGPLYVEENVNGEEKYVVAGVVSYGDGCAYPDLAGIYTKVSAYLDWIRNYMS